MLGGRSGAEQLVSARHGCRQLVSASVWAVQSHYGDLSDRLFVYGKEKVYGSIP